MIQRILHRWIRGGYLASICCLSPEFCMDSMHMVREAGFTPMKPPNTLYGPGAVVGVMSRGPYIEVYGICGVRGSLGPGFTPIAGPTQREELTRAAKKRFKIGAELLEQITGEVEFHNIRSISVAFENPRIMALQIEDVIANMGNRSQACKEAIEYELRRPNTEVTMVTATLEGDLIYSIGWKIGYDVDLSATVPIVTSLAARLGFGQAHCSTHSIQSRALVWGIKDDLFLAELSIRGSARPMLRRISSRIIPPNAAVDLTKEPIAPVVESTNPANAHYRTTPTGPRP